MWIGAGSDMLGGGRDFDVAEIEILKPKGKAEGRKGGFE
jgi:hypothetical protein